MAKIDRPFWSTLQYFLGYFEDETEAAKAYDEACKRLRGPHKRVKELNKVLRHICVWIFADVRFSSHSSTLRLKLPRQVTRLRQEDPTIDVPHRQPRRHRQRCYPPKKAMRKLKAWRRPLMLPQHNQRPCRKKTASIHMTMFLHPILFCPLRVCNMRHCHHHRFMGNLVHHSNLHSKQMEKTTLSQVILAFCSTPVQAVMGSPKTPKGYSDVLYVYVKSVRLLFNHQNSCVFLTAIRTWMLEKINQ